MLRRSRTSRAFAALAGAAALSLLLAGCGGGDDEAIPTSSDTGEPTAEEQIDSALEALRAPEPDKVVATVNGAEIRAGKVYEVAALNLLNLEAQGRTLTEDEEKQLRMRILELIINDELMAQAAERLGLEVPPEDVESQMQEIRDQHGTAAAFQKVLEDAGLDEQQFREEVARRLMTQQYVRSITDDIQVAENEAKAFYDQFPEQFSEGETVEVRQILIRSVAGEPEGRRNAARERAEEAHARAVAGEDFAALAKEFSQAPNAADGGLVSHFPRGVMVPRFEEVAFATGVGEISDVFETPYGFNIIQVTDRKPAKRIPFAEIKPKLMVDLAKAKEAMVVQANLQQLQADADVRVLDPTLLPPEPGEEAPAEAAAAEDGKGA